jgi:signal transduction histidine kinase
LDDLRAFLAENSLGLLVASPRGSSTPTLLVALGVKANEWPFTYPEVERLQNVAELMDNILTRSRLTMQAALRAKMEHLAMMSRGLAHDLNNLITPVSSFLVHTRAQFPAGSAEHEVHEAASHSVQVMSDYVKEALFFSSKLEPRIERVELRPILREAKALTASRATARGVAVTGTLELEEPVYVDAILIQRLLVNLVGNAIDASEPGHTVAIVASPGRTGWFRLEVRDTGCGIPPEIQGRIFDPYFTTKQFGEEVRGFGLGLTISQKIVQLHNGNITVRSLPGAGTVISIDLPVAPAN